VFRVELVLALECGLEFVSPLGYGLVLKSWLEWRLESVSVLEQGVELYWFYRRAWRWSRLKGKNGVGREAGVGGVGHGIGAGTGIGVGAD
jgi:hypothetical protein